MKKIKKLKAKKSFLGKELYYIGEKENNYELVECRIIGENPIQYKISYTIGHNSFDSKPRLTRFIPKTTRLHFK